MRSNQLLVYTDVGNQFPTAVHLCSSAALVPGHNESAGKRKSSRSKKGNKYLRSTLTEAAQSVRGSKNYLGALYNEKEIKGSNCSCPCDVANRILPSNPKRNVC